MQMMALKTGPNIMATILGELMSSKISRWVTELSFKLNAMVLQRNTKFRFKRDHLLLKTGM